MRSARLFRLTDFPVFDLAYFCLLSIVACRAAALSEAAVHIQREIYAYRSSTGSYSQPRYRNAMLASAIRRITAQLLSTEAAAGSVPRMADFDLTNEVYRRNVLQLHSNDDALSPMHISDYNEQRLEFQQKKFRTEAKQFATRLKVFE